jgi:hypothetical protein
MKCVTKISGQELLIQIVISGQRDPDITVTRTNLPTGETWVRLTPGLSGEALEKAEKMIKEGRFANLEISEE